MEYIDEVHVRIDPLEAARREEALNDPDVARAHFRPAEQPVFAAQGNGTNLPFQRIKLALSSNQSGLFPCIGFSYSKAKPC